MLHSVLGSRLCEITKAVLLHRDKDMVEIFGSINSMKFRSCTTIFDKVSPNGIYTDALRNFYNAQSDSRTLAILNKSVSFRPCTDFFEV